MLLRVSRVLSLLMQGLHARKLPFFVPRGFLSVCEIVTGGAVVFCDCLCIFVTENRIRHLIYANFCVVGKGHKILN